MGAARASLVPKRYHLIKIGLIASHFSRKDPTRTCRPTRLVYSRDQPRIKGNFGGVYLIPGRLPSRREFTPVPSYGSVFVYIIPTQNVMPARVIPARVHPGSCAGARFSSRHENSFQCHGNGVWLFVSYPSKFHQFYGTIRLAPQQTWLYVNTVQLFISPRYESRAIIM